MKEFESETFNSAGSLKLPPPLEHHSDPIRKLMVHKRQTNAAVGGLMPLISYGLYFMWGIYALFSPNRWNSTIERHHLWHATVAFFIGSKFGFFFGYYMVGKFRKIVIYAAVNTLMIISGALLIPNWTCIAAAIVSRYLGGIGLGIASLTLLVHLPEVATKDIRGAVVATISVIIAASLLSAGSLHSAEMTKVDSNLDQIFGGLIVLYAAMGLVFLMCFTVESPVFLIMNNQEQLALSSMMRLRLETHETWELRRDFHELKAYINDEKCLETVRHNDKGILSFCKILSLRLLYVLSTSFFMTAYFFHFTESISTEYGPASFLLSRLIAELLSLYLIERFGRKKLLSISCTVCGFIMISAGFLTLDGEMDLVKNICAGILAIVYQTFIGLGLSPVSAVYVSEWFSVKRKRVSIMVILIAENILQSILVFPAGYAINLSMLFFSTALIQISSGYIFNIILPETKGLSLRECLHALK